MSKPPTARNKKLIHLLRQLESLGFKNHFVTVWGDSNLVVRQMNGTMKIGNQSAPYSPLAVTARQMTREFREKNS
jgi:ribonuclease HI